MTDKPTSVLTVGRPNPYAIQYAKQLASFITQLSGGYEDDEDAGETFTYTGAGGRDLSGNKRTAEQSCDQTLTKTNLALAVNCAAKVYYPPVMLGYHWLV